MAFRAGELIHEAFYFLANRIRICFAVTALEIADNALKYLFKLIAAFPVFVGKQDFFAPGAF